MSQASIPNITPEISITLEDSVNLLLASIALEELALAHIINAEGEKIQYIIGTLPGVTPPEVPSLSTLLTINDSVRKTLQSVIAKEIILNFKMENVLDAIASNP